MGDEMTDEDVDSVIDRMLNAEHVERPQRERAVLELALQAAIGVVEDLKRTGIETMATIDAGAMSRQEILSAGYLVLTRDAVNLKRAEIASLEDPTRGSLRCGYCIERAQRDAGGDTAACRKAVSELPMLPWDAARRHVATCENNPLARVVAAAGRLLRCRIVDLNAEMPEVRELIIAWEEFNVWFGEV